jgi:hypothetical protein
MENPVYRSIEPVLLDATSVGIDVDKVNTFAQGIAKQGLETPTWDAPVFPKEDTRETLDFFMVGNVINFAFTDFATHQKWETHYQGKTWNGAFGMWAALKRAVDEQIPILDGEYLKTLSREDAVKIFAGNMEIPLLEKRVELLNNAGKVLSGRYKGRFSTFLDHCAPALHTPSKQGIVDKLTKEFACYQDSEMYDGKEVVFNKRAQLAPCMLASRFTNDDLFHVQDINEVTVFADYNLPRALHGLGILKYAPELERKVLGRELIAKGSEEEVELRAFTIATSKMILSVANRYCNTPLTCVQLDYKLFSVGRKMQEPHHLTMTTAY